MKFLIDMNLSPAWATFLAAHGFEATHWSAIGPPDADDRELMKWASTRSYIILTNDLDFTANLAATGRRAPSVVQLRMEQLSPKTVGALVLSAIMETRDELAAGALISVNRNRARLRILPLK